MRINNVNVEHRMNRRTLLRSVAATAAVLGATSLLYACGEDDDAPSVATTAPAQTPAPSGQATTAPDAPADATPTEEAAATAGTDEPTASSGDTGAGETPKRGGILPTALGKDPENLLIMHYVNGPLRISTNFCYGQLVRFRAEHYHDVEVDPSLAESWEVSEDGTIYTFKLQQGVKWHNVPPVNGREFTSADVAWTAEYYKTMNTEYGWLYDWVESWETPDDYTVIFNAPEPYAESFLNLAVDNSVIMAKEVYDEDGSYGERVVGTGPFIWTKWDPGVKVEVRKNPDYWEVSEFDGEPLPYLDGLDMFILPDYAARLAAFRSESVSGNRWGFQPEGRDVESLVNDMPNLRRWDGYHFLSGNGLILNTSTEPFNEVLLRHACSMALDRDAIVSDAIDGRGQWAAFISPAFVDYVWSAEQIRELPLLQYNPDEARRIIQELGADGLEIRMTSHTRTGQVAVATDLIQQMWQEVGLNAVIDAVDVPTAYERRVTGDFHVLAEGVGFSSASLDAATRQLYHSTGERNYSRISDPELDTLTEQQFRLLDVEERRPVVDQIQQRVYELMPHIPHYVIEDSILDHDWVKNRPIFWQLAWPHPERVWMDR